MYAAALFPDRFQACGVELRSMTLGHALLLQRVGSPFARSRQRLPQEGPKVSFVDVLTLVFICSRGWRQADRDINRLKSNLWMRWKWITRRWDIAEDTLAIMRWHQVQWAVPSFTPLRQSKSGFERGSEFVEVLMEFCCRNMGCDHERAMDVPFKVASYHYLVHAEGEGAVRITNGTDDDLETLALSALKETTNA